MSSVTESGYRFVGWLVNGSDLRKANEEITITGATTATPVFVATTLDGSSVTSGSNLSTAGLTFETNLPSATPSTYITDAVADVTITGGTDITDKHAVDVDVSAGTATPDFTGQSDLFASWGNTGDKIELTITVTYADGGEADFTATYTHP